MSKRRTAKPSVASDEALMVAPGRGRARRRVARVIVAIILALLLGGLGGFALYLFFAPL